MVCECSALPPRDWLLETPSCFLDGSGSPGTFSSCVCGGHIGRCGGRGLTCDWVLGYRGGMVGGGEVSP